MYLLVAESSPSWEANAIGFGLFFLWGGLAAGVSVYLGRRRPRYRKGASEQLRWLAIPGALLIAAAVIGWLT